MNRIQKNILLVLQLIEILIAVLLLCAIFLYCIWMIPVIRDTIINSMSDSRFEDVISFAFSLVIGVEFVKMICIPTTNTVVEVLMFAIARSLIVEHPNSISILLGVISIAILFATKKYFFCDFDKDNMSVSESVIC